MSLLWDWGVPKATPYFSRVLHRMFAVETVSFANGLGLAACVVKGDLGLEYSE